MLRITIPARTLYDERTDEFIEVKEQKLQLEHSLVSLSKWEAKWKKPFLDSSSEKTDEEAIDYVRCMTITQNVDPNIYYALTQENVTEINAYMNDDMTATWFSKEQEAASGISREKITSELVYYWMIRNQIPVEFEKWHLNRLLTLIKVCNIKDAPSKKMTAKQIMQRNRALNDQRRAALHTKG